MKKIFILAVATLLGSAVYAQQPDAVYKLLRQEWTVNADGTSDYHYRHEVQILRNRALVAYADKGETFVVYNPELEELTVNEVYTLQKDGTRVEMPQNAFVYQLPSQCADCGRFNHLRELAMVHTGMELGCTIVVDYTIHRHYSLLNQTLDLVRECPVERLEVSVRVPGTQELNVRLADPEVFVFKPTVEQTDSSLTLTAINVPQSYVDSYLPVKELLYPMLHFYNGVPEFAPAFDRQGLSMAKDVAYKLIDSRNARENIVAIQNYVIDNIHLNDIEPAKLGYVHSTAAEVWQTGCGTATDKAVLLAAMLNEVGYSARVIGDAYDEVGVMIDTLEYRLGVRHKGAMALYGEAKDEVKSISLSGTYDATLDTLGDGFFHFRMPAISGSPAVKASNLAIVRSAPLQSSACDINSDVTYLLPKGVKLVGGIDRSLSFEGVGSVQVMVKQSGKKLRVVRKLKLEQTVVPVSDYSHYRQLLALWQETDEVLLRAKQ
ncbi:MAG: DUF3857 domain-containing protein [Bacteroidales bacterium]|nr:DUF3857 domain-containing protein [Bacteroidales bacterium]